MISSSENCNSRLKKITNDKPNEELLLDGPKKKRPSKKQKLKKDKKSSSTTQGAETSQIISKNITVSSTPSNE